MTDAEKRELIANRLREALRGEADGTAIPIPVEDCRVLLDALEESLTGSETEGDEQCEVETYSWSHFTPEQLDPYWIRCTQVGDHDRHQDSNTGLSWEVVPDE